MQWPRFTIRTIMALVALMGLVLWGLKSPTGFIALVILSWAGAFRICMKRFHGNRTVGPSGIDEFHAVVGSLLFSLVTGILVPVLLWLAILTLALFWITLFGR